MSANGRVLAGERPYVDFSTPIQSATFLFNLAPERLFGGTFIGMTFGVAILTALCCIGFTVLLARRWPAWLAALITLAVVTSSLSQHTIIWHNTLGVVCLAAVSWAAAIAPILRRSTIAWHLLIWAGLVIGGINKLNFQLLALALVIGWTIREGLAGRASSGKILATISTSLVAGLVLPVLVELGWTHASLAAWWHNVVVTPLSSRSGDLTRLETWQMLWSPLHDYYGSLTLRPIGALCLIMIGGAVWVAWRNRKGERSESLSVIGAGLLSMAGALALYATNYEIGYVALSGALVLAVALWLGFGLVPRGWLAITTLVLPAVLMACTAWESAWRGQRSQFGHTGSALETYVDGGSLGPAFAYFRGLNIPREWAEPAAQLEGTLPPANEKGTRPIFYGQGMEWLEQVYPSAKQEGMPLWMHFGTTYGPDEIAKLSALLGEESAITTYYTAVPWFSLPDSVANALQTRYEKRKMPGFMARWIRKEINDPILTSVPQPEVRTMGQLLQQSDSMEVITALGGNTNPLDLQIRGEYFMFFPRESGQPPILGITKGRGEILLSPLVHHFRAEAVLRRNQPGTESVYARFAVRDRVTRATLWSARLKLDDEDQQKDLTVDLPNLGVPVEMMIEVPDHCADMITAGYRQIFIQQTDAPADELPPQLRPSAAQDQPADLGSWASDFPDKTWSITHSVSRGTFRQPAGLVIPPGGEFWFHADQPFIKIAGEMSLLGGPSKGWVIVRIVYAKGPRLDVQTQFSPNADGSSKPFHAWSPESGGWFGLLVDAGCAAPVVVNFTATAP